MEMLLKIRKVPENSEMALDTMEGPTPSRVVDYTWSHAGAELHTKGVGKMKDTMTAVTFVGLDTHKDTIAAAVARVGQEPESLGVMPNTPGGYH